MAWNYKRNELRGTEMIPNRGMWTSLPGLVKVCTDSSSMLSLSYYNQLSFRTGWLHLYCAEGELWSNVRRL